MKLKTMLFLFMIGTVSMAQSMPCLRHKKNNVKESVCRVQKVWKYCPEYVDVPECEVCPEVKYRRLKRYTLREHKQKYVKYVPQYYYRTIAQYEPEYYYQAYTVFHPKASKKRCCVMVPKEVNCKVRYSKPCQDFRDGNDCSEEMSDGSVYPKEFPEYVELQ